MNGSVFGSMFADVHGFLAGDGEDVLQPLKNGKPSGDGFKIVRESEVAELRDVTDGRGADVDLQVFVMGRPELGGEFKIDGSGELAVAHAGRTWRIKQGDYDGNAGGDGPHKITLTRSARKA